MSAGACSQRRPRGRAGGNGAEHGPGPVDLNAACSGFIYGLDVALGQLESGRARGPVLLIGVERFTPHVDYSDRGVAALFGDGAGAVVLAPVAPPYGVETVVLGADGSKEEYVRLSLSDIDAVVTHQANVRMIQFILDRTGILREKSWFTGDIYGNTGAASIPITLQAGVERGRLGDGDTELLQPSHSMVHRQGSDLRFHLPASLDRWPI
ncbi:3-oxoacyl-ACP synthase III family protein [Streptomyces chartreusis]|uniref:3-oxoacyl-ACP synthase III family protein n=1 Tax=Streptomyces chartreusis TaxID=1969 RepID=UPI002E179C85